MTARLRRLLAELRADHQALDKQLSSLEALNLSPPTDANLALAAWCLHHAYTSVESILLRITRELGEGSDTGSDWHQRLLDAAALEVPDQRPALLSASTVHALHELRSFRHFVRHGYAASLDPARLSRLREGALELRGPLDQELLAIEAWLGTLAKGG